MSMTEESKSSIKALLEDRKISSRGRSKQLKAAAL